MNIELKPITFEGLDCYVTSILSVLNWKMGQYQYAFWDSWCFNYCDSISEELGECLCISMEEIIDRIVEFYGMQMVSLDIYDEELSQVKECLGSGDPVLICVDTFYCEWYENFLKQHANHVIILTGIKSLDMFYAVDTIPVREKMTITMTYLRKGIIFASKILFTKEPTYISLKEYLSYVLERKKAEFEQMKKFQVDLIHSDLYKELNKNVYIWRIAFLNNIRRVYGSRICFLQIVDFLAYREENEEWAMHIHNLFKPIIAEWGVFLNVLYKAKISMKVSMLPKELSGRMEKIIKLEIETYKQIAKMVQNNRVDFENYRSEYKIIYGLYNSCSHFWENKDFTRKTMIPETLTIKKNMSVSILNGDKVDENCIICVGQHIKLPKLNNIKKLHLIGYATWGNQMEKLLLKWKQGLETDIYEINMSDWCLGANFGEDVVWNGVFEKIGEDAIYNGHIYNCEILLKDNRRYEEIILPNCANICLFGICLEFASG